MLSSSLCIQVFTAGMRFPIQVVHAGGVLDNDEIQAILALPLRYCRFVPISKNAWATLQEMFTFASQQGRLAQPWGVNCVK
jgi:hypothetical protein